MRTNDPPYASGEEPGKGTYICTKCGATVTLDQDIDKLPSCSSCGNTTFDRVL
ncbi:MAG: hypothetical protein ABIH76_00505 [Candidatus Bathyarchaeota archaeon]